MKKIYSLLAMALMLLTSSAAFAFDWTVPETRGVVGPIDGLYCYIVNVAAQRQMVGRQTIHDWSTTTGLADDGVEGQRCKLVVKDGAYYILRASDSKHNFRSGANEMHVDMASQGHDLFVFVQMPNGNYQIKSSPDDDLYGAKSAEECWGWMGADAEHPNHIYPNINPAAYDPANTEWQLVEDMRAVIAEKAADAESVYSNIDLTAIHDIFVNTNATAEELAWAAGDGLAEAISKARSEGIDFASATVESPVDASEIINNRSFENGDLTGWSINKSKDTGVYPNTNGTYTCDNTDGDYIFNTWDQGNKVSQKVYALPDGLYAVSAMVTSSDDCTNVYLVANDQHKVVTLMKGPDGRKQTHLTDATLGIFVKGGVLEIGAVGSADAGAAEKEGIVAGVDWTDNGGWWWYKADNFRLTYYGPQNDEANAKWLDINYPEYEEDYLLSNDVKEKWNGFRDEFNAATDDAGREAALANLEGMKAEIAENEQAWADYQAKLEVAKTTVEGCDETAQEVIELADYLDMDVEDIINAKEITTEGLKEECEKVEGMITAAKRRLKNGTDVTFYMKNPNFNDASGWQGDPAINNKCGEKYNAGKFEVYQEVSDLPMGLYEVSMQGFYRKYRDDDDNKTAWYNVFESTEDAHTYKAGQPDPLAFVFMNDSKTPLNCVYDFTRDITYEDDKNICGFYEGTKYSMDPYNKYAYPNDMASAARAFAQTVDGVPAYQVSAYGLVAKDGDKLRIGVKGDLGTASEPMCSWAIFDNFKLTFRQKDPEVIAKLLPEVVAKLDLTKPMGADVKQEALEAISTAETAEDNNAKFEALVVLYSASSKIDASVENFETLGAKLETFSTAISDSQAKQEVKDAAGEYYEETNALFESGDMTDAQSVEAIAAVDEWMEKLAIPDYESASDDDPVEMTSMIKDADITALADKADKNKTAEGYTTGTYGAWSYVKNGGNGPAFNSGNAVEFWNDKVTSLYFDFNQVVVGLPEGTYELTAMAGNSFNGQAPGENGGRAVLYAEVGEKETPAYGEYATAVVPQEDAADVRASYTITFKVGEGQDAKIGFKTVGKMDARWFTCDDFKLYYYGKESKKDLTPDDEETDAKGVKSNEAPVAIKAIYTLAGNKVSSLQEGQVNIVVYTDDTVKKITK
ncbi:MAG: hypothetical protein KBT34_02095 [Prevotella sp.]|nr:hypothetical protein [Candidatus Prevotella equi]